MLGYPPKLPSEKGTQQIPWGVGENLPADWGLS